MTTWNQSSTLKLRPKKEMCIVYYYYQYYNMSLGKLACSVTATNHVLVTRSPSDKTQTSGRDGSGNATVCFSVCPRQICSVWSAAQLTKSAMSGSEATARMAVVCVPQVWVQVPSDVFQRRTVPSSLHDIISTAFRTTTHRTPAVWPSKTPTTEFCNDTKMC